MKKVSSKQFIRNLMNFRTDQEKTYAGADDDAYDSYTKFFRNVFGHPDFPYEIDKVRSLYLNTVADAQQCNKAIKSRGTASIGVANKWYMKTTKCYICGKPLKREKLNGNISVKIQII